MKANGVGFHNLLKLVLKFCVKDDGYTATCLHCGYKEGITNNIHLIPLYQHVKTHIMNDEITADTIRRR